ncbi:MAG: hypothetical protein GQ574_14460 [Crocinitomix sp.]|nr:hypothetical protein [Crocinitomix sp.]
MGKEQKGRPKNELVTLLTILAGIIGFIVTFLILIHNINLEEQSYKTFVGFETKFQETNPKGIDTLILGAPQRYHEYIDKVVNDPNVDTVNGGDAINPWHSKESTILYKRTFYGQNERLLNDSITSFDNILKAHVDTLRPYKKHFTTRYPEALQWILFISIAIGFSMSLIPVFLGRISHYWSDISERVRKWNVIIALLILLSLILLQTIPGLLNPEILMRPVEIEPVFGVGFSYNSLIYTAVAPFIGPFFFLILILTINSYISILLRDNPTKLLRELDDIRLDFEKYFKIIAAFIAFSIISTSILLSVCNKFANASGDAVLFASNSSYINGFVQTFFLLLIYFSVSGNISYARKKLSAKVSVEALEENHIPDNQGFLDYLKIIAAILAPLLGTAAQDILSLILKV